MKLIPILLLTHRIAAPCTISIIAVSTYSDGSWKQPRIRHKKVTIVLKLTCFRVLSRRGADPGSIMIIAVPKPSDPNRARNQPRIRHKKVTLVLQLNLL